MKKLRSSYSNSAYGYSYIYYYETKKVLFYLDDYSYETYELFKDYFGDIKIEFNSLKEFKFNLANFNKAINKKIKFKHKFTQYHQGDYIIKKLQNNNWEARLKEDDCIESEYGRLEYFEDYKYLILLNKRVL